MISDCGESVGSIIERRKARWRELYDPASGRKAVFQLYFNDPDAHYLPGAPPYPEHMAVRVEASLRAYEIMYDRCAWFDDDSLPFVDVGTGTEIFAEAFGCGVYRYDNSMPSARPIITEARQVAHLKQPDLFNSPLAMLFDMGDELRRRAGRDALVKIPDIQSPMDIAALIWDKNYFYMGVLEEPQAVIDLADMCRRLLTEFADAWFDRYGRDHIAHFPAYYVPRGLTLSEDEIGAVNPDMFRRFFLPQLQALSEHFGGLGMHCCANARHQWENLKAIPGLKVLNLVQPAGIIKEAYVHFARHVIQIHDGMPGDTPPEWYEQNAPAARVILRGWANDKTEALRLSEHYRRLCEQKRP